MINIKYGVFLHQTVVIFDDQIISCFIVYVRTFKLFQIATLVIKNETIWKINLIALNISGW